MDTLSLVHMKILLLTCCRMLREEISGLQMVSHTLPERSPSITVEEELSIESSVKFLSQLQAEFWQTQLHTEALLSEKFACLL